MVQERRRWSRIDCDASQQGVLLRLQTPDGRDPVCNTMARDLSVGGLSFDVKKNAAIPDPFHLKVFLPNAYSPLDCPSRIAWQQANGHTIRAGVAFIELAEDQQRRLSDFLREVGGQTAPIEGSPVEAAEAQPPPPQYHLEPPSVRRGSRREHAIWQFEQGVLLYHQRSLGLAKREFQKVIKDYADVIDVARVARRYHDWCEEEQET